MTNKIEIDSINYKMTVGRFKGKSIAFIIDVAITYFEWMMNESGFKISNTVINYYRSQRFLRC